MCCLSEGGERETSTLPGCRWFQRPLHLAVVVGNRPVAETLVREGVCVWVCVWGGGGGGGGGGWGLHAYFRE